MHASLCPAPNTRIGAIAFLLIAPVLMTACSDDRPSVMITDAWIAERPTGRPSPAGIVLRNHTGETQVLQLVKASDFGAVGMIHADDPDASVDFIPTTLKHGDMINLQLILSQPKERLRAGDSSLLTLNFADGRVQWANAEVRKHTSAP